MTRTTGLPTHKGGQGSNTDTSIARKARNNGNGDLVVKDHRHYLFPYEYIKDCCSTKAAIRCGYSERSASAIGSNLFRKHRNKIEQLLHEKEQKLDIDTDRILSEVMKMAMVNPNDFLDDEGRLIPMHKLPRHVAAAISSFEAEVRKSGEDDEGNPIYVDVVKYKVWDKKASNELLMKYLGLLVEKKEITGKNGKPLIPQVQTVVNISPDQLTEKQLNHLLAAFEDEDPMNIEESEE